MNTTKQKQLEMLEKNTKNLKNAKLIEKHTEIIKIFSYLYYTV